jgi:hypothetical protein
VVLIRSVKYQENLLLALVCQISKDLHLTVALNVSATANVQTTWLVSIKNVQILVQERVDLMPNVA